MRARGVGKHGVGIIEEERDKERHVLGLRVKKGLGVRTWLLIDVKGSAQVVEAGKHAIMRRACLPARDLRILDPQLSYPSTILGREHAIVVNLEHIKAIITAQEVLLLNFKDDSVAPFVRDLRKRLPVHFNALGQEVHNDDGGGGLSDYEGDGHQKFHSHSPDKPLATRLCTTKADKEALMEVPKLEAQTGEANKFSSFPQYDDDGSPGRARGGPNILPFEFRALEACLEAACSSLDNEALDLEKEAYPALDELTSKISTLNLERVRQIKSRLVAISGRVQKVRDEIEQLLDDDGDMAEMYLTDKLLAQQEGSVSPSSPGPGFGSVSPGADSHTTHLPFNPDDPTLQSDGQVSDDEDGVNGGPESLANGRIHGSRSSSSTSTVSAKPLDVEELEMLLEAYFVQVDGTLNKLSTLREYVDDTEDYINIMLDDKQNHLLQMGVMLTTATLVISAFIVVTGVFGMNINIPLFNIGGTPQFLAIVFGSAAICVVLYFAVIGWCKYKHLIE
ncbi:magnesium transporter MRS2-3 [Physcomitrium patens]|uniref:Magnesium transporter n=1 Tax=Physcomitrium patens TaxID=3218 RepID=A0A2K1L2S4_PHYPA|nr:magnesium transporter MRS2-3-like [Physcomitrium patens]PNR60330.1 hypothetical protein PHYPA_003123 [Physcomitrium patens]|eukprot:XP_024369036.1 magnesium transporter MRS2-3-like [Physcomitrella patens]